jgi:hypothetical protein
VRQARLEILDQALRLCGRRTVSIASEQISQGGAVNPTGDAREKGSASEGIGEGVSFPF